MSAKERLQKLRAALEQRGARDVKFCFAPSVHGMPLSEVHNGVFDFLDAYLNSRSTPVVKLGDAPIAAL